MLLANAVVGLIQLVIAIIFAVVALYIGFAVLSKITKDIDEEKELAKGNVAVGIIVASVFVAIALVVQSGVSGLSVGINKAMSVGILSVDGLLAIGALHSSSSFSVLCSLSGQSTLHSIFLTN